MKKEFKELTITDDFMFTAVFATVQDRHLPRVMSMPKLYALMCCSRGLAYGLILRCRITDTVQLKCVPAIIIL